METTSDFASILCIFITSVGVICYIYGKRGLEFRNIILIGFVMRLALLFADYYGWFPILNSGTDTEMFHKVSAANVGQIVKTFRGGYTQFLTIIYTITGTSRLIAQYCNLLFGMGVILLINSCIDMIEVSKTNKKIAIYIVALLPNLNIFSAILLREAWVEFFVALSLYYFVKWFIEGRGVYVPLVMLSLLSAAFMHAGVLGLMLGYIVAFLTYNPKSCEFTLSQTSIVSLVFIGFILVGLSSRVDIFTSKFAGYQSIDDIIEITNGDVQGDSGYLTWINVNSIWQSILFAPLKIIYFLFSPLPTEWRRANDIVGFVIDGALYMGMFYAIIKYKTRNVINRYLKRYLLLSILFASFIFAYGTKNAGTAFRHRAKIVPVIVLLFALSPINDKYIKEEL